MLENEIYSLQQIVTIFPTNGLWLSYPITDADSNLQAHTPQLLPPLKKTTSNKTGIPATTETLKISNTTTSRVQTATLSSSTYRSPIGNTVLTFFIAVQPV